MIQTIVRKATERSRVMGRELFTRIYMLLTASSCGVGVAIMLGRADRFSGASFRGPRDLASIFPFFPPWVYWSALFLLHGLVLICTWHKRSAVHVLRFGVVVYAFLTLTFIRSVIVEPTAAGTACVAYPVVALIFLFSSDYLQRYGWEEG